MSFSSKAQKSVEDYSNDPVGSTSSSTSSLDITTTSSPTVGLGAGSHSLSMTTTENITSSTTSGGGGTKRRTDDEKKEFNNNKKIKPNAKPALKKIKSKPKKKSLTTKKTASSKLRDPFIPTYHFAGDHHLLRQNFSLLNPPDLTAASFAARRKMLEDESEIPLDDDGTKPSLRDANKLSSGQSATVTASSDPTLAPPTPQTALSTITARMPDDNNTDIVESEGSVLTTDFTLSAAVPFITLPDATSQSLNTLDLTATPQTAAVTPSAVADTFLQDDDAATPDQTEPVSNHTSTLSNGDVGSTSHTLTLPTSTVSDTPFDPAATPPVHESKDPVTQIDESNPVVENSRERIIYHLQKNIPGWNLIGKEDIKDKMGCLHDVDNPSEILISAPFICGLLEQNESVRPFVNKLAGKSNSPKFRETHIKQVKIKIIRYQNGTDLSWSQIVTMLRVDNVMIKTLRLVRFKEDIRGKLDKQERLKIINALADALDEIWRTHKAKLTASSSSSSSSSSSAIELTSSGKLSVPVTSAVGTSIAARKLYPSTFFGASRLTEQPFTVTTALLDPLPTLDTQTSVTATVPASPLPATPRSPDLPFPPATINPHLSVEDKIKEIDARLKQLYATRYAILRARHFAGTLSQTTPFTATTSATDVTTDYFATPALPSLFTPVTPTPHFGGGGGGDQRQEEDVQNLPFENDEHFKI